MDDLGRTFGIVSVDDHIVEPPRLWVDRLPARFHDRCPRVVRETVAGDAGWEVPVGAVGGMEEGRASDIWLYEDIRVPTMRFAASAGMSPDDVAAVGLTYDEMRPGCYDAKERLADMDVNGVDVSICFPNLFIRFCGQRFLEAKDAELALLCVKAYNDFLVEEWMHGSGGRLHGVGILPLWDVDLCVDELQRNAAAGLRNVCFPEIPAWLGLPSLHEGYWDPLFSACAETGTIVQMHIGSSSKTLKTSTDSPQAVTTANMYINSSLSLSDMILSGLFERFPALTMAYAESQAGWIPYILARLDSMWDTGHVVHETRKLSERPSTYFKNHVYSCIFDDPVAVSSLIETIGEDRICFEVDYPHPDGTWPHSQEVVNAIFSGVDPSIVRKIVRSNGLKMLGLSEESLEGLKKSVA